MKCRYINNTKASRHGKVEGVHGEETEEVKSGDRVEDKGAASAVFALADTIGGLSMTK